MNLFEESIQEELLQFYASGLKMQINPLDYLAEDDELILITGRSKCLFNCTKKWAKKYFPKAKLFMTNVKIPSDQVVDFHAEQVRTKAEVINREKVDVYFEDNPVVVKGLRIACPNTKIIQYGSRL